MTIEQRVDQLEKQNRCFKTGENNARFRMERYR